MAVALIKSCAVFCITIDLLLLWVQNLSWCWSSPLSTASARQSWIKIYWSSVCKDNHESMDNNDNNHDNYLLMYNNDNNDMLWIITIIDLNQTGSLVADVWKEGKDVDLPWVSNHQHSCNLQNHSHKWNDYYHLHYCHFHCQKNYFHHMSW